MIVSSQTATHYQHHPTIASALVAPAKAGSRVVGTAMHWSFWVIPA